MTYRYVKVSILVVDARAQVSSSKTDSAASAAASGLVYTCDGIKTVHATGD